MPDDWLGEGAAERAERYVDYFVERLAAPRGFVVEAEEARRALA